MSYPGGKGRIYQELINLMPPHDAYIETFLGDGAVMRRKRPAARNIGIDVDERVIRRWLGRPPAICGEDAPTPSTAEGHYENFGRLLPSVWVEPLPLGYFRTEEPAVLPPVLP